MGLKAGDSVLGRYEVVDVLGRGGMGEVHRGRHKLLGHTVALKVLTDTSPDTEKRFLREAKLMALVRSPYIVTILDFGHTADNEPCIAMEFIEGEELRVRLRRTGAMPWPDAVALVRDIAHGLQALHSVDVLHRDLKPANVVVAPGPPQMAKIIDFGIARPTGDGDATRLTSTGALVGTPAYMAPEQLLGMALDARSDLYAVGLILHELLTGQLPFPGGDMAAVIRRLQSPPPRAEAPEGRPPIPLQLQELILQCLAADPNARPNSAGQLVAQFEALLRPQQPRAPVQVDVDGVTGIAADSGLWQQTAREAVAVQRTWEPPQQTQNQRPPQPSQPEQSQPMQSQPTLPPQSGGYPVAQQPNWPQTQAPPMQAGQVMWAPVMQSGQGMPAQGGWVQVPPQPQWPQPQAWPPYATPNPYAQYPQTAQFPQTTQGTPPPWMQQQQQPQQIGPQTVPGAAGVRYLVVVKLPPSKLAMPEERRWLASVLGHHGRSFTFGSQFWFALQVVPSPANDAGVAVRGIIQNLAQRYPNQVTHKVRFMAPEFSLNPAQLTGAQPLPAELAEMLGELA